MIDAWSITGHGLPECTRSLAVIKQGAQGQGRKKRKEKKNKQQETKSKERTD